MQQRKDLEEIGKRILSETRTELYLSLRFLGPALDALGYQIDLRTRTVGTDGAVIRFNPRYLIRTFMEWPQSLTRAYLHMLMHGLFRHIYAREQYPDGELFDLCADIAAESLVDSIDDPAIKQVPSDFRESCYRKWREEVQVLTAEKLYHYFSGQPKDVERRRKIAAEFGRDDHGFWETPEDNSRPPQEAQANRQAQQEEWQKRARKTQDLLAGTGRESADDHGSLAWVLAFENNSRTDYREFLRRFAIVREEMRIDPDGFDYGYYHFGLEMYGNMPLIEENEFRETLGIDQLVIAIDTSGSTKPYLVERFLRETAAILAAQETFLHHVEIWLLECDNQVQKTIILKDVKELSRQAGNMEISGGMGTDFRPAFRYVQDQQRHGKLSNLRGLLYFTDGYGTYPEEATPYDTAFVYCTEADYDDSKTPDWAMKLYTGGSRWNEGSQ